MSDIYSQIIREQKKQGNLGGFSAYERKEEKRREKARKKNKAATYESEKSDVYYVEVTVHNAVHVAPSDPNGLSDPYVKFYADGAFKSYRTPTVKKSLNPTWDYTKIIKVDGTSKYIKFELWDEDLTMDDYQGKSKMSIPSGYTKQTLSMHKKGDQKLIYGQVSVTLRKLTVADAKAKKGKKGDKSAPSSRGFEMSL